MLKIQNLTKTYTEGKVAVDNLTIQVEPGISMDLSVTMVPEKPPRLRVL